MSPVVIAIDLDETLIARSALHGSWHYLISRPLEVSSTPSFTELKRRIETHFPAVVCLGDELVTPRPGLFEFVEFLCSIENTIVLYSKTKQEYISKMLNAVSPKLLNRIDHIISIETIAGVKSSDSEVQKFEAIEFATRRLGKTVLKVSEVLGTPVENVWLIDHSRDQAHDYHRIACEPFYATVSQASDQELFKVKQFLSGFVGLDEEGYNRFLMHHFLHEMCVQREALIKQYEEQCLEWNEEGFNKRFNQEHVPLDVSSIDDLYFIESEGERYYVCSLFSLQVWNGLATVCNADDLPFKCKKIEWEELWRWHVPRFKSGNYRIY